MSRTESLSPAIVGRAELQVVASSVSLRSFRERIGIVLSLADRRASTIIEQARPPALRTYDQIPMRSDDLLFQAKFIAPHLAHKTVAFVGDYDSASALLGLLATRDSPSPTRMIVLDFDERVLTTLDNLARRYGFADRLQTHLYNVFDPVPADLVGTCDWFYTNPPYGSRNDGASGRLFITRGAELTRTDAGGCIILPDDRARPWTHAAMRTTQQFLLTHCWQISEKFDDVHQYHLDDDCDLFSSLILVHHADNGSDERAMPYAGRCVPAADIPFFYGGAVTPPYPRLIGADGKGVFDE